LYGVRGIPAIVCLLTNNAHRKLPAASVVGEKHQQRRLKG